MKRIISERLSGLSLKEVPFTEVGCVKDEKIKHFQRHVNHLLPRKSMDKFQSYVLWKEKHCKEEHYALQIEKCMDPNCCTLNKLN